MSVSRLALRAAAAVAFTVAVLPASPLAAQRAPASPRDSVKTTIAGAALKVDYGRPSKRGRVIFGGLEKWGNVWRTGANEATHFTTSKPLMFGSATVPAGTYTLYTLLDEGGKWQLIVNKQTGQWGTEYKQEMDLVRIPLTVTQTPAVVEQMEITARAQGCGRRVGDPLGSHQGQRRLHRRQVNHGAGPRPRSRNLRLTPCAPRAREGHARAVYMA